MASYAYITLTTNIGLDFVPGQFLQLIHDKDNYIVAYVISYDTLTGVMVIAPTEIVGSGDYSTWTLIESGNTGPNSLYKGAATNPVVLLTTTTTTTTTSTTSTSTTSTTTTLSPVTASISSTCSSGLADITMNNFNGGTGTYFYTNLIYSSIQAANDATDYTQGTSVTYSGMTNGLWYACVKDSAGTKITKSIRVTCTTTTTSTTTTTTTQAPASFDLSKSSTRGKNACFLYTQGETLTYYAINGATLANTTVIYTDQALTTTAPIGYYSDGTNYWYAPAGGILTGQTGCNATTTTTTTTTTIAPLRADISYECSNGLANITMDNFSGGSGNYQYTREIFSNVNDALNSTDYLNGTSVTYYGKSDGAWYACVRNTNNTNQKIVKTISTSCATTSTTTTTTTQAPASFDLSKSSTSGKNACFLYTQGETLTYYAMHGATLANTTVIYTDQALTTTAPIGYYSDGTNYWYSPAGGILASQTGCNVTTSTTSTTTTVVPLSADISYVCSNGLANITMDNFGGGSGNYQYTREIYSNVLDAINSTDYANGTSVTYYGKSDGGWYACVRDTNQTGHKIVKTIVTSCATTSTTTTTTTEAPPANNWQWTNNNTVQTPPFGGGYITISVNGEVVANQYDSSSTSTTTYTGSISVNVGDLVDVYVYSYSNDGYGTQTILSVENPIGNVIFNDYDYQPNPGTASSEYFGFTATSSSLLIIASSNSA